VYDAARLNLIQQLGAAMSDVSEECYHAGWMDSTQDVLPELCRRAIESGEPQPWGHGEVAPPKAHELWALAERIGAWADLHPQDDSYIPYHPFPLRPGVADEVDRERRASVRRRRGNAG
jgi:hypothetical protein